MELKQYLRLLWRWSWLMALITALAGITAYVVSSQTVPVYEASITLLINQTSAGSASPDLNSLRTSEGLARTYVELLRKRPVLEAVIAKLKLNTDPEQLTKLIQVTVIRDTQLMVLAVEDTNPQRAADIANEIVRAFSQQNRELQVSRYTASKENLQQELLKAQADVDRIQMSLDSLGASTASEDVSKRNQLRVLLDQHRSSYATLLKSYEQVRVAAAQTVDNLNVVEAAQAEHTPIRPRILLNTILAAIVGALLAVGLVVLVTHLDNSVKSSEEVEELIGVSTLASIARITGSDRPEKLVAATAPRSLIAETYRLLKVNIEFSAIDKPIRTLVVTSSSPGEGKSHTVANLAVTIAQAGKRVILVDTDLRRPVLHESFRQTNMRGVTTALLRQGEGTISDHIVPTGIENLRLMPSGPLPPNPAELLGSTRMNELIEELKTQADMVLLDSPPLLSFVDAALLARACDATVLVVLAASTQAAALRRVKRQLLQSGTRLLGTVLNRVSTSPGSYSNYSYYRDEERHKRQLQWRPGLRLPFLRGRNSSPDSIGAITAPDNTTAARDHHPLHSKNESDSSLVEALATPDSTATLSDGHFLNGRNGSSRSSKKAVTAPDNTEVPNDREAHRRRAGGKGMTSDSTEAPSDRQPHRRRAGGKSMTSDSTEAPSDNHLLNERNGSSPSPTKAVTATDNVEVPSEPAS